MNTKIDSLPDRPPAACIEFLCATDTMQEYTLTIDDIFTIPEFHPEEMYFMPSMSKPDCKFPDAFFHTAFYVRVDDIVDECDLHLGNLYGIIVLIQEHHTLENRKEKDLNSGYDEDKGNNCCRDF